MTGRLLGTFLEQSAMSSSDCSQLPEGSERTLLRPRVVLQMEEIRGTDRNLWPDPDVSAQEVTYPRTVVQTVWGLVREDKLAS